MESVERRKPEFERWAFTRCKICRNVADLTAVPERTGRDRVGRYRWEAECTTRLHAPGPKLAVGVVENVVSALVNSAKVVRLALELPTDGDGNQYPRSVVEGAAPGELRRRAENGLPASEGLSPGPGAKLREGPARTLLLAHDVAVGWQPLPSAEAGAVIPA